MGKTFSSEADRPAVRAWRFVEYLLWLPLGTLPEAIAELREIREHRDAFLQSAREDPDRGYRPLSAWEIGRAARQDLPDTGRIAFRLMVRHGADARWVYKFGDPLMVYVVLPTLFVLAGLALGGAFGALTGFALLASIWFVLVERLRQTLRNPDMVDLSPQLDAVVTLPNILTTARMGMLWFFPVLLSGGHHIRAMVFFGAVASTDWADGFIARHYSLRSRLGTMLDPAADRILMCVVLLSLLDHDLLRADLGAALIGREIVTIVLALVLFRPRSSREEPRAEVHWAGKLGFAVSTVSVVTLLAVPPLPTFVRSAAEVLLLLGLVLNVYALILYTAQALGAPSERPQE
jgi:CDP-diacylglycerol--glycerol-3-phosphate 3-phosphatidyltransferase